MNARQKAFAEYYIKCGNATEAAKKAGYKEKYAGTNADKLLKNTKISAYIAERLGEQSEARIADANEVLEFFTNVMRGNVKDQFGLDSSLSDRLNAGKELMKRYDAGKGVPGATKREDDPLSKALKEEAERMNNGDFS